MSNEATCKRCGTPIPRGAPFEACFDCLAELATGQGNPGHFEGAPSGEFVGNYRLIGTLGEGAFGVVYEAQQAEPVQRRVALKLLKRGMDSRQVVARFEAERQALALMDHPNVAAVFDAGEHDDGRPFFVMELVEGQPITEFCVNQSLDLTERIELFIAVCEGVQHAHSKAIIHRDLKPSNVLVAIRDGKPIPKVIDFGVAKATESVLTQKTVYTEFGQVIGTPVYMSPEQAVGAIDVDTRSDVYSLGALLYEILTDRAPFDDAELRKAGFAEMERMVREETPPKPSTRVATSSCGRGPAGRSLRGDLDWIVMKAMDKEPDRRYATALGLARDLRRHLRREAVDAGPPSRLYLMSRFAQRNKALIGTATGVALALLAGTAVSTLQAVRASRAEAEAVQQAHRASLAEKAALEEAAVGEAVSSFMTDQLVGFAFEDGKPDAQKIASVMLAAEQYLAKLDQQPLVQAGAYLLLGRLYYLSGFALQARSATTRSLAIYRDEIGSSDEKTLRALELHLKVLLKLEAYEEVDAELTRALPELEVSHDANSAHVAALLDIQQQSLDLRGRQQQRRAVIHRMMETNFTDPGVWRDLSQSLLVQSQADFDKGDHKGALDQVVKATLVASVHNRGGFWRDERIVTLPARQRYMDAGVAPREWSDFREVLAAIDPDRLENQLPLPAPAMTMAKAYLLQHRGDASEAAAMLSDLAARHPRLHPLQHAAAYYLELAGSDGATEAYLAAAIAAAREKDFPAVYWYASNWDRLRRESESGGSVPAHRLPRSAPVRDEETGHIYQCLEIPLNWPDARDAAEQLGGHLATLTSESENELVYSRFAGGRSCWLGASRPRNGEWTWIDGSPLEPRPWRIFVAKGNTRAAAALAFGNTPRFQIFDREYGSFVWGKRWFHLPFDGLVKSPDYNDPLRNAMVMFALCEWDSEEAWEKSKGNKPSR